jgi:hypothetical protein
VSEATIDNLREFLSHSQGREVSLAYIRQEMRMNPDGKSWENVKVWMHRLTTEKIVKPSGKKDGIYKVVKQVQPVRVFIPGRERRPVFPLRWPEDRDRGMPLDFTEHIVVRENDVITIGGVKSRGKTSLCLNLTAVNLGINPILMGNEYTVLTDKGFEPTPRFLNRLDAMDWVEWTGDEGEDRFTLLPIREDYTEHIIPGRLNIIDWLELDADKLYEVSKTLHEIKNALGRGVAIVALQKSETASGARGGQFVRDFSDVELLLDGIGKDDNNVLLTVRGCKEKTAPIVGKTYAYSLENQGTSIVNFREVKQCSCKGFSRNGSICDKCLATGWCDA